MSQHQPSPSSSDNGDSNRPTRLPQLPSIPTTNRNNTTSRASRLRARRSATRVLLPVTFRCDLQRAATAAAGFSSAPNPENMRFARIYLLIRGLISSAQDGADLHRQNVETARLTAERQALFQNQLDRIERSVNTIVPILGAWRLAANADNADDNMRILITSVSRMVTRVDNIDTAGSGDDDSDSGVPLWTCFVIEVVISVNACLLSIVLNILHDSTSLTTHPRDQN